LRFAPVGEILHHSGGSVRRLSYKADLMLSSAMVRLHLKHGGLPAAFAAWFIILVFNLSRAVFWTGRSITTKSQEVRDRRDHFFALVGHQHQIWPGRRTSVTR
jgi:hypothetical protein